jgi:hypothetical protein
MARSGQWAPSPREAWLSDGRQVLHFRPSRWDRWRQSLEVTSGEWLPDQATPLLKHRRELSRAVIYGSVMGSYCCEKFGVDRFRTLQRSEIDARFQEFRKFTDF